MLAAAISIRVYNKPMWLMVFPRSDKLYKFYDPSQCKTYCLELPELDEAKVCHSKEVAQTDHGHILLEPKKIVDRRLFKKNGMAATQVLVKWFNAPHEDSTREDFYILQQKFPSFFP
ncbi:hypothetical protein RD792_003490 [Penstemon davidsonii]|uniref:Uncharacterized protein n=1 Tax=Penstemon davidsonii TaxID=160366 RepID=A0ABR0DUU3_9LAMI|nr:hypothetical protein RD792_003490 [Penstemon davidsonii]